jgi:hypothetical protein
MRQVGGGSTVDAMIFSVVNSVEVESLGGVVSPDSPLIYHICLIGIVEVAHRFSLSFYEVLSCVKYLSHNLREMLKKSIN